MFTPPEFATFFDGLDLVPPGTVPALAWSGGEPGRDLPHQDATFLVGVARIADGTEALNPGQMQELRTVAESMTANTPARPSLIVSASGMAAGGRVVLHHLRHLLPDPATRSSSSASPRREPVPVTSPKER
jgi:Beta-Casp domain